MLWIQFDNVLLAIKWSTVQLPRGVWQVNWPIKSPKVRPLRINSWLSIHFSNSHLPVWFTTDSSQEKRDYMVSKTSSCGVDKCNSSSFSTKSKLQPTLHLSHHIPIFYLYKKNIQSVIHSERVWYLKMTSFMALDGVTSFLRLKDVTNTCKRMRSSLSIGWSSSVQWRKVGKSWRLQMCFGRILCVRIEIDQLQCMNCWVIIHCLSVSCTKLNHSRYALVIWSSLQLTSKQWIITQQITAETDLFLNYCICPLLSRYFIENKVYI